MKKIVTDVINPLHEATKHAIKSLSILLREDGPSMKAPEPGEINGFEYEWAVLEEQVHDLAVSKGWWEKDRNPGEALALIHAEVSECLEALREPEIQPSTKAIGFNCVEEELADIVIRVMDFAHGFNYDVAGAIEAKFEHNQGRAYKHGHKKF